MLILLKFLLPIFLLTSAIYAFWIAYFRPYQIHSDYDETRRRNLRITAWFVLLSGILISVFFLIIGRL